MRKLKIFFAGVVKHDIIKHFAAFESISFICLPIKVETHASIFKNGLTSCMLLITNFLIGDAKMCLRNKRTATQYMRCKTNVQHVVHTTCATQ